MFKGFISRHISYDHAIKVNRFVRKGHCVQRRLFVTEQLQHTMVALQQFTGLPWWATFASSTIALRVCLFPLVRMQIISSNKMNDASEDINRLTFLLKKKLEIIFTSKQLDGEAGIEENEMRSLQKFPRFLVLFSTNRTVLVDSLVSYVKGLRACFIVNNISVASILIPPFINLFIFASFTYSMRTMIIGELGPGLQDGGLLWFRDLTF